MQNWRHTNNKRQSGFIKSEQESSGEEWNGHEDSTWIFLAPENPS